jgi:hypothetical protein
MRATLKSLPRTLIVAALFSSGFAQQPSEKLPVTRSVVVNVLDEHGNAVRDLTKEDFRVRLNGAPVTVLNARYSLAPRRVLVLLDVSGSMGGEGSTPKWKIAREAADDLLTQTPRDVPIAMMTFASEVRDVFDFAQGRTAIVKWLEDATNRLGKPKGRPRRTALLDAILKGLKLLEPSQAGDALYLITDGGDNASHVSLSQTKAVLLQSGVRLFAFLFDDFSGRRIIEGEENASSFWEMAKDSGGCAFYQQPITDFASPFDPGYVYDHGSRERIKTFTQQLNVQVHGFWTLDLIAPPAKKQEKMSLELAGREGKARKDVWLTYPRLLPAAQ